MIDFILSSTDSNNLEGYVVKLKKKGFKVEKKTFSKIVKGEVNKYSFYVISIETIQELINLRKIVKSPFIIMDAYYGEDIQNRLEIYDDWRE